MPAATQTIDNFKVRRAVASSGDVGKFARSPGLSPRADWQPLCDQYALVELPTSPWRGRYELPLTGAETDHSLSFGRGIAMLDVWNPREDDQVSGHELFKDRYWGRLVTEVGRVAAANTPDEFERDDYIRRGLDVVEMVARAVNPNWWDRDCEQAALAWHHRSRPLLAGKKHGAPYINRLDVEEAAAMYLALPYRVDTLDRLLTDLLMAAEMFGYADEMQPLLRQKLPTLLSWLWGNFSSLVIGLSVAGILVWLAPDTTIVLWIAGIVAGLTLLGAVFSLVVFPFLYPVVQAERRKIKVTVAGMLNAYTALGGAPASVPHIRKLVDRATDAGVIWPAPLMALLDDIADRRRAI
jgi:hypothetical protein